MRKLLVIAGVPIDDLTMEEALVQIEEFIKTKRPHQIATVNADFVVKVWDDSELRNILNNADLLTADGMPLVWGAKLLGVNLQGRVTGADLVPAIAERGAKLGWRIFFLGGKAGVPEKAAKILTERYPGFQVAGIYSPPFAPVVEMTSEITDRIKMAKPDILFVAFGNPKQEKWIYLHNQELGVPVSIGVGGSLDFVAGEISRAPLWMQNSGLEWVYRLIQEPRRMWKRYFLDLVLFARFFLIQLWRQQLGKNAIQNTIQPKQPHAVVEEKADFIEIVLSGPLTIAQRSKVQMDVEQALQEIQSDPSKRSVHLYMSEVVFIDSSGMGLLVNLTKQARNMGKELYLIGLRADILTTLRMIKLDQFLSLDIKKEASGDAKKSWQIRRERDWWILSMPDRLEGAALQVLQEHIETACKTETKIICDFQFTSFMDSSGIAGILNAQKKLKTFSGVLVLAGLQKDVRRILELSGVARYFQIAESVDVAINSNQKDNSSQEVQK
ncbi:MAG: WecB/TagA/CpsF family glycosyltransferase [Chloroflexi bacterium]|nr:WecB/TagA/CpsF family glycosyltransferase [Chloroflexota bacterium]